MATKSKTLQTTLVGKACRLGQSIAGNQPGAWERGEVAAAFVQDGDLRLALLLDSGRIVEVPASFANPNWNLLRIGDDVNVYEVTCNLTSQADTRHPFRYVEVSYHLGTSPKEVRALFAHRTLPSLVREIVRIRGLQHDELPKFNGRTRSFAREA